jgi:RNA recognition motif-containing protein
LNCELNGESRGFAYIQFGQPEEAQKAILEVSKRNFWDNKLEVDIFKGRDIRQTETGFTNLFVCGLNP